MAAEGPNDTPAFSFRRTFLWTEIFRCFQVALDPRKLLAAAAGILVMSLGWYALSGLFNSPNPPVRGSEEYSEATMHRVLGDKKSNGTDYKPEEYQAEGTRRFERDLAEWKILHNLAGDGGRLRTLPWNEYRGENPFLLVTSLLGGTSVDIERSAEQFVAGTVPVLVEPLRKLLIPVVMLFNPNASFVTRIYLLLCMVWSVATWAFFGGIITRIAAVQFGGKERTTLKQATQFVVRRYTSYVLSPLVPLAVIAVIVIAMAIYGLLGMIPGIGDVVLYGIGMPLVLLGGIVIAILLVGLIGYPLMFTTLSTEGSDTFDALSRSYNYVFQAPWSYIWYNLVAVLYGAAVVFFVVFLGSLMVYMGKLAVSQAPFSEQLGRKPDFLFIYSPESFGWKQLLLAGSDLEVYPVPTKDAHTDSVRVEYVPVNPDKAKTARENLWAVERIGAGMVTFWMVLVFLLVIGFSYSYFWSAATMVYLLMRKKVDETELDEVYVEEEPAAPSMAPPPVPPSAPASAPPASVPASLPMVTASNPIEPPAPAPAPTPTMPPTPTVPPAPEPAPAPLPPPPPPATDEIEIAETPPKPAPPSTSDDLNP